MRLVLWNHKPKYCVHFIDKKHADFISDAFRKKISVGSIARRRSIYTEWALLIQISEYSYIAHNMLSFVFQWTNHRSRYRIFLTSELHSRCYFLTGFRLLQFQGWACSFSISTFCTSSEVGIVRRGREFYLHFSRYLCNQSQLVLWAWKREVCWTKIHQWRIVVKK